MSTEVLKNKNKEEIMNFIRQRLSFDSISSSLRKVDKDLFEKEHRRFEMSGYESNIGECTVHNMAIVNEFADLGIYNHTHYLFVDFHKGCGTLYLRYFGDSRNLEFDLSGYGTTEIIYKILEVTIFSGEGTRRRDW